MFSDLLHNIFIEFLIVLTAWLFYRDGIKKKRNEKWLLLLLVVVIVQAVGFILYWHLF